MRCRLRCIAESAITPPPVHDAAFLLTLIDDTLSDATLAAMPPLLSADISCHAADAAMLYDTPMPCWLPLLMMMPLIFTPIIFITFRCAMLMMDTRLPRLR